MDFNCYNQGCITFSKPAQLAITLYYIHQAVLLVALILSGYLTST